MVGESAGRAAGVGDDGRYRNPVTATLLSGDERQRGMDKFLAYPMYRSYLARTDRELRLFALTPR